MNKIIEKFRNLSNKEIQNISYEELVKIVEQLSPEEIVELSRIIGYPVFTRLCMGVLKHRFVLIQSGAAAIIENQAGEILMQRRSDDDKWGLPGGCQEIGEELEDTVIREVKEEANLVIKKPDLILIGLVSGDRRKNIYPNGDIVYNNTALYLTRNYSGELRIDEESKEMRFFGLDILPDKEFQHDADLIDTYTSYLRRTKR